MTRAAAQPATAAKAPVADRLIDPASLMRLRSMELRARIVVEGFYHGIHRSPYHGFSVEFTEYRPYVPGDDTRYLDWRLLARTDRYYIKKYEDETNLRCHLLVDHSRSMSFTSGAYSKAEYAATLAATLGRFLAGQGDAVGAATFDSRIDGYLPPRNRPGHLRRLMLTLDRPAEGRSTDLAEPLRQLAELIRKRGLVVLISDLLAPAEALKPHLAHLRAAGHEAVVFNVLDPAELAFSFDQAAVYEDLETGRTLQIDPAQARQTYQQRLEEHLSDVAAACADLGIDYHRLRTDRPLELALFDFLRDRGRRAGSKARRRRPGGTAGRRGE